MTDALGALAPLLGGVGLFLLGMGQMTDGLRFAGGETLRVILERWTRSAPRAFAAGFLVTGVVQSSTATTVATVGFVNAGLLTLRQAVWVVAGANLGTTLTGWIVALVGLRVSVTAAALPVVGVGALAQLLARERYPRLAGLARALAGFGLFFMGLDVLQEAFRDAAPGAATFGPVDASWPALGLLALGGLALTLLTQSSAASIAIVLSAASTGSIGLVPAAAVIIGVNVGTTSTAAMAAIGATPPARRVAASHVIFNVVAAVVAFVFLEPYLWVSGRIASLIASLAGEGDPAPLALAAFHTLFSAAGVALLVIYGNFLVRWLEGRFRSAGESVGSPQYLDDTLLPVPALAARGLLLEVRRYLAEALAHARRALCEGRFDRDASQGLRQLGGHIRQFIGDLSETPMPQEVSAALPDLIRATQNLDDFVGLGARLHARGALPVRHAGPGWTALGAAVLDCLSTDVGPATDAAGRLAVARLRLDDAFDRLKQTLLAEAAGGRTPIFMMEEKLSSAEALRDMGYLALRARRRVMSCHAGDGDVGGQGEAHPAEPAPAAAAG